MTFNTALSGLSAASSDLEITGNNIANAGTVGFKGSRAEFADVYASSLLGSGSNQVGGGVKLANIAQQFDQGTISFTNNSLDMAIDGNGFFVLSDNGARAYTRAGNFGVDNQGYVVATSGARVQGFTANDQGTLSGIVGDLQINTSNLAPSQTTQVQAGFNLDARSQVLVERGTTINTAGDQVGVAQAGTTNGYATQDVDVVQPDGSAQTISIAQNAEASAIAAQFSSTAVQGASATATTTATIPAAGYNNPTGTLSLNGVALSGATLTDIANYINSGPAGLGTVSATINGGDLVVTDAVGNDLSFGLTGGGNTVDVTGTQGGVVTLDPGTTDTATIGGTVEFTLDEDVTLANASPALTNLFGALDASQYTPFELNTFDPTDQETYNHATSLTIFDSLGNPHVMSMYFVKEPVDQSAGTQENQWSMYLQIDDRDVGDPDPNLPPPQDTEPTRARFDLLFNPDGTLNPAGTDSILVSNWVPRDENGDPNGAEGPQNVLSGGSLPISQPPTSSNFELRLNESTQYGSEFAVSSLAQNGYTTGELSGLAIDEEGVIAARFTNGQNQTLGQIAVADFENVQGLSAVGDTAWVETNASGGPIVAAPGAGSNGNVISGALEDSNVELSEELVQLIISQRNFQANARTITTADEIQQTIINL